ncbi:MAG: hypothetical protein HQK49_04140 [Oligoflexia bacterium]|nr:hypothetical protein [Oligoflexia bacterium]
MERKKVAGIALCSGKNEKMFLCLFEYFGIDDRWFLTNVLELNDDSDNKEDLLTIINEHSLKNIVVDFPLTLPACQNCTLKCPGHQQCIDPNILFIRKEINTLLTTDKEKRSNHPKQYENDRVNDNLVDVHRNYLNKKSSDYLLSKPFKRRITKGVTPYWNRSIDFYIWLNYYDPMLNLFNLVYDSFSNSSLMKQFRYLYWKKFYPHDLFIFESNIHLILIEMLRNKIISQIDLKKINSANINDANLAREHVIDSISSNTNIFIYETDKELLIKNPKAFQSFILGIAGRYITSNRIAKLPEWTNNHLCNFIIPQLN